MLAWESGLFDCQLMQEALAARKDPVQAAEASLFRIWGESGQTRWLFQYLQDTQASENPLWTGSCATVRRLGTLRVTASERTRDLHGGCA